MTGLDGLFRDSAVPDRPGVGVPLGARTSGEPGADGSDGDGDGGSERESSADGVVSGVRDPLGTGVPADSGGEDPSRRSLRPGLA